MLEQSFPSMNAFLTLPTPKSFYYFFSFCISFFCHDYSLMLVAYSFFLCCIIMLYHAFKRAMSFPVIVIIWMKCNWTFFSFQLLIYFMLCQWTICVMAPIASSPDRFIFLVNITGHKCCWNTRFNI